MFYIVGLGNPGEEYKGSRHNAGRSFLEYVAKKNDFSDWKDDKKMKAMTSTGMLGGKKVMLINPETFMNNSGNSVRPLELSAKALESLVVVYDDLDLPIGKMKISFNRSAGGHNGVASIIKAVKSEAFPRIRLGVSPMTAKGIAKKPSGEDKVIKFLMTKFRENDMLELKKVWKRANLAIETMIAEGREKAMTLYND
ncbi:MAG: aminoacyl-tRNA hydrolase [Candidatus Pacebacteria bacterium]|nr:aminoacyl-tRNA hydrolase [Candidatus Paceibacterota bacterium]MBP9852009.1 aminoacyl-tRNA hydrolase [Candidatus Paceibacterota bacterium]